MLMKTVEKIVKDLFCGTCSKRGIERIRKQFKKAEKQYTAAGLEAIKPWTTFCGEITASVGDRWGGVMRSLFVR